MSGPLTDINLDTLHQFSAGIGTYAGARLVTLSDGRERGVRLIEMRSGGGVDIDVAVDRSGDIGRLSFKGQTLSWHPATGLTSPGLMDHEGDNGQGFLRGFGGFLNTCGLDHIRQPDTDKDVGTNQGPIGQIRYPLHGKGTFQPGVIRGYGLVDDIDVPYVFCEVEFCQGISFVSSLRLRRRIEMPVGAQHFTIRDTIRNIGSMPATHMLLYHFNLGFPLISPGTDIDLGVDPCIWQSREHAPTAPFPPPDPSAANAISVFEHVSDTGCVTVSNKLDGMALQLEYPSAQLPYCQVLRMTAPGIYGLGIEPCTTAARSRQEARDRQEMIVLQPNEQRQYCLRVALTENET